ncbi:unnamed protein product [Eretmochelys imbricata]
MLEAFLKKSDALEFLGKIRKRRDVDGGCAGGRCTFEEDNDVFDDTSFGHVRVVYSNYKHPQNPKIQFRGPSRDHVPLPSDSTPENLLGRDLLCKLEFLNFYLFRSLLQRLHYSGKYQDSVPPSDGVSTGAHHDAAGTLLFGSLDCFDPEALSGAQFREVFDEEGELKAAVVYRLIKPRQRRAKTNHL